MVNRVDFGWVVPSEGAIEGGVLPLLSELEAMVIPSVARHFDSLWIYDHLYAFRQPTAPYLEAWTALTWLAGRFPGMDVGTVVLSAGYRNPALLAKMAGTLHALSPGRFILGLGAGWRDEEFRAYGYPFPDASERIQQLEEAVRIIRLMWTETNPSFHGEYFQIDGAYCYPQPSPPGPIMIGGDGEQLMLPLVGRLADWWNVGQVGGLEDLRRKRDIVHRSAEEAGRDPGDIRLTHIIQRFHWPATDSESRQWVDYLKSIQGLGFDYFIIDARTDSYEIIERFNEQVIEVVRAT